MARVKGAMMTRKRRNKILKMAKGYWGSKSKHFRVANQAVMKSGVYAYVGRKRRSGTGCVSEINDHLFEGRYSPKWPDGKKHARNVYAHTREECEEKLKVLIIEMKTELAELKKQKAKETLQPQVPEGKKGRKKSKKAKKDK